MSKRAENLAQGDDLVFRPANVVMDLERLGTLYPYPLSFMRSLIRKIMHEKWEIKPAVFDLDEHGFGDVVYEVTTPNGIYSYVLFSKFLDPESRSDRVIAEDWRKIVMLFWDRARSQRTDGSLVRFTVPLARDDQRDVDQAEEAFSDLASQILPRLAAYVPE